MVRHAKSGDRLRWPGPDRARPLSPAGRRQAERLPERLGLGAAARVLSSPYVRCVQTVEPLAARLGLEVEVTEELAEGAGAGMVERALAAAGLPWVLCTHGDVIDELVYELSRSGLVRAGEGRFEKGATWVVEAQHGVPVRAEYMPPPEAR